MYIVNQIYCEALVKKPGGCRFKPRQLYNRKGIQHQRDATSKLGKAKSLLILFVCKSNKLVAFSSYVFRP